MSRLVALAALLIFPGIAVAGGTVVLDRIAAKRPAALVVSSADIGPGGHIAARNTAYGQNRSLSLGWPAVIGARAWAVILEDPDAPGATPFVHWLVWNIPAGVTRLSEGVLPPGAIQGRNGHSEVGYWGPHPPSSVHRYHIEVFALDAPLALRAGADRDALADALRGHVIAKGEILGLVAAPHG
jgi:Raf kinase inhibitor-like YbhB/YbcL family protein